VKARLSREDWLYHYVNKAMRRIWGWYPVRKAVKDAAQVRKGKYQCADCREVFARWDVQVDHIQPVIPVTGFDGDWNAYINRLFCDASGLRVLCVPCHSLYTVSQNSQRKR
jgi:hypothetical protein